MRNTKCRNLLPTNVISILLIESVLRTAVQIWNFYVSGDLFCRGKGDYYRLGHGSDDHVRRPKRVAALQNKKVVAIATGSLHCVACTDTGEVYTWGDNDEGQLGDGSTSAIQRPRLVTALQVSLGSV